MPTKSEMTVSTGAMKNPASMRGTTSLRDRVGAERAQRVDLVGDHHRPELGGDARADAAGEHQRRQHRPELLDHRRADQPADDGPRAELVQRQAALQRQRRAGEQAGQQHDGQRPDADHVELLDDVVAVDRRREDARGTPRRRGGRTPAPRARPSSASAVEQREHAAVRPSAPAAAARARGCAGA